MADYLKQRGLGYKVKKQKPKSRKKKMADDQGGKVRKKRSQKLENDEEGVVKTKWPTIKIKRKG